MRHLSIDDSSNVSALAYDPTTYQLIVEFKNGSTYRYDHVQLHQFGELAAAQSVGKLLNSTIVRKSDAHPFTKVAEPRTDAENQEDQVALMLQASAQLQKMRTALERIANYKPDLSEKYDELIYPSAFEAIVGIAQEALKS